MDGLLHTLAVDLLENLGMHMDMNGRRVGDD